MTQFQAMEQHENYLKSNLSSKVRMKGVLTKKRDFVSTIVAVAGFLLPLKEGSQTQEYAVFEGAY